MVSNVSWYKKGHPHIWHPYTQMQTAPDPLLVTHTEGTRLYTADGRSFIDGVASWWAACHGYNHPHILQAVKKQLDIMPHVMFAGIGHEPAYTLAHRLAQLTGLPRVFFTDSGSTAIETAMKMAVQYWKNLRHKGKVKFVTFSHSYHGDTMGCMSLCDQDKGMHKAFGNYMPMQYAIPLPSDEYGFAEFDALLGGIQKTVAAVIIEPLVQAAGGMKFHSPDILAEIHRITKKHNVLFIADEIMTGFGRTGRMFAMQETGTLPDILCIGKALTGGTLTLAATLANDTIYQAFLGDDIELALMSGPTYTANPLACAAAHASLDLFEKEPRLAQVEAIESQLYEALAPCKHLPKVLDVRVKGAIGVVQIETSWKETCALREAFLAHHVWLRPFGDIIALTPPFTITSDELHMLTNAVYNVLQKGNT